MVLAVNNQAWNSIATWYTVINKDGSTIKPGSPSEPEKVGIEQCYLHILVVLHGMM